MSLSLPPEQAVALGLRLLALADVLAQGDVVGRPGVFLAAQRNPVELPDDLAVLVEVAGLDVEAGNVARHQLLVTTQGRSAVRGMHDGEKIGRQQLRSGIAGEAAKGGVDQEKAPV